MPQNKFALLRYRIIDRCIRNKYKPYPSREDLRAACEEELYGSFAQRVSLNTIDKDIAALKNEQNLGYLAPIAFSKVHGGYYYTDPEFALGELPLNAEDADALKVAAAILRQYRDLPPFRQFEETAGKILDRIEVSRTGGNNDSAFIQFESAIPAAATSWLSPLLEAIRAKKQVRIHYKKFSSDAGSRYTIVPFLVKEYHNRWYTVAQDVEKGRIITLGLERIENLTILQPFEGELLEFNAEDYFRYCYGITSGQGRAELVKLRFLFPAANYVLSQPLHKSQTVIKQTKTYVELSIEVYLTVELQMDLLRFGDQLEVLSPQALRTEMENAANKLLKVYMKK